MQQCAFVDNILGNILLLSVFHNFERYVRDDINKVISVFITYIHVLIKKAVENFPIYDFLP